jgi:hypothetical protein
MRYKKLHLFLNVNVHNRQNKNEFTMLTYFEIGKAPHVRHASAKDNWTPFQKHRSQKSTPIKVLLQRNSSHTNL